MKELSIEEKAKRYDEAIKLVNTKWYYKNQPCFINVSELFPEFKENKDENIKKWLIEYFQEYKSTGIEGFANGLKIDTIIDWLEKQGEQSSNILWHDVSEEPEARGEIFCEWKSSTDTWHSIVFYLPNSKTFCEGERIVKNVLRWAYVDEMLEKQGEYKFADKPNKVDPIFHEGDWIVSKSTGTVYQIRNCIELIHTHKYGYYLTDGAYISSDIVNQYCLWTIQDAREGDTLCTYECDEPKIVFILKGTPKKHRALRYHCYYNIMYPYFESDSESGCLAPNEEDVKPATEEQRDLLFQKMKEAGYKLDVEKN